MANHKKSLWLVLILGLGLSACQTESGEAAPDVSDISIDLKIRRFEQDLFSLDTLNIESGIRELTERYGPFARIFFSQIVPIDNPRIPISDPNAYLKGFITHPEVRQLYRRCSDLYQDFSPYEKQFTQAFKYLKYYFPDLPTPDLTTFISEYSYGCFIYEDQSLAIGLDFFLGADYPYQKYNPENPNFSQYLTRTFTKEHLVLKTLLPLVSDLCGQPRGDKLLDHMLHNGKQLYILKKLLPQTPDSILMEVTGAQNEWLKGNERDIWAFFLSEDLLYNSDWQKIRKYVEYSPNSPGMPAEAPGRTGDWMGWQIVKAYMQRNPQTSLTQLIEIEDSQDLLNRSGYKPPRGRR